MFSKRSFVGDSIKVNSGSISEQARAGDDLVNYSTALPPAEASLVPHVRRQVGATLIATGTNSLPLTGVTDNGLTAISSTTTTFTLNETGWYDVYMSLDGTTTTGTSVGNVYFLLTNQTPASDPYLGALVAQANIAFDAATANNKFGQHFRTMYFEAGTVLDVETDNQLSAADTLTASFVVEVSKVR